MDDVIVSAAVYFYPKASSPVPVEWLDDALRLLAPNGVPVSEFETVGASTLDETQIQAYTPNADRLRAALASEPVKTITLRCREADTDLAIRRQAEAQLNGQYGYAYLGLPFEAGVGLKEALLATHRLGRKVAAPDYGIAYLRSGRFNPLGYALGYNAVSALEFPAPENLARRDRIARWHTERLLSGHFPLGKFRSVYPVQLLTEAHRQSKLFTGHSVADIGVGVWTPLEDGMWLWELTENQQRFAEDALEQSGLLISA